MFYANACCHHNNGKWIEGLSVLRRIFWIKWEGLRKCWRGLCNEGLNNLSSSSDIVRVIKSRSMGWRECNSFRGWEMRVKFCLDSFKEAGYFRDRRGVGGWIAFIWLGSRAVAGSFKHYSKPFRSWKWRQHIRSKSWNAGTSLGGVTTRETTIWVKETSGQHSRLGRDRIHVAL